MIRSFPGKGSSRIFSSNRFAVVGIIFYSLGVTFGVPLPWMNEMQERYGAKGFQVIGVNVDAKSDDARRFLAETPAKFVVAFDAKGEAPKSYAIKGMPTSFLVGPDGKVLLQHAGFRDSDREALEAKIRQSLGGK